MNRQSSVPVHVQLTTGDVGRFTSIASRMFGEAFPDVVSVELRADAALGAAG